MNRDDNPYAAGDGYSATIQLGDNAGAGQPAAANVADLIRDTTTAQFTQDVIQESRNQPVLVDFWAPWCGPCKQLTPSLEKAVTEADGRVKLVKMNIDEHPSIAGQMGIQSIPAVIVFKDGQPVDGFMGAVPESQIRELIDKVAGDGGAQDRIVEALAAAAEARDNGDIQGAAQIYQAVAAQDPENVDALGGLADLLFEAGHAEQAAEVLARAPEGKNESPPIAAVRAKMDLAGQVSGLGDAGELEQRIAADPKDHQARFDLALIQNAGGDRAAAADSLLAIVKADRSWHDDGAKAQLLKFFDAWGPTDEATLAARRKLSSLLFS